MKMLLVHDLLHGTPSPGQTIAEVLADVPAEPRLTKMIRPWNNLCMPKVT